MNMSWALVIWLSIGAYAFKMLGFVVVGGRKLPVAISRCLVLIPAALLAALVFNGTFTNGQGVFSIVVLKGDEIEFSYVGYKPKLISIPKNMEGNRYSIIQLMVIDTVYLPATIIKPRPRREQFEREFVNTPVPDDQLEIARQNALTAQSRLLQQSLPKDGSEASNYALRNIARSTYYSGQIQPQAIFSPLAWAEFIRAWKRGDFKAKK